MPAPEGYPPLYLAGLLYRHQRVCFDTFLQVQLRSKLNGWIRFFAETMVLASEESIDLTTRLTCLREAWWDIVKDRRADSASRKLVEVLIGTPIVTAGSVKEMLSCSFPAADNAIADLVSLGILKDSERKRNLISVAHDVTDLLQQRNPRPGKPSFAMRI